MRLSINESAEKKNREKCGISSLEEKKDSNGKGGTTMSPTLNIADQLIRISNVFTPGAAIKTKEFFYW